VYYGRGECTRNAIKVYTSEYNKKEKSESHDYVKTFHVYAREGERGATTTDHRPPLAFRTKKKIV